MFFAEMEILEILFNPLTLGLLTSGPLHTLAERCAPLKFSSELQRVIEVIIKGMLVITRSWKIYYFGFSSGDWILVSTLTLS